jgi:hypothetical protein
LVNRIQYRRFKAGTAGQDALGVFWRLNEIFFFSSCGPDSIGMRWHQLAVQGGGFPGWDEARDYFRVYFHFEG